MINKNRIKKSFRMNNYILKSGILDLLFFILLFLALIISASFMTYYLANVSNFEQNYSAFMQQSTPGDDYNTALMEEQAQVLQKVFYGLLGALFLLMIVFFAIITLIRLFQYKILNNSYLKSFKDYWQVLRNTFPFFFIISLIIYLLFLIKTPIVLLIILLLILLIIYWSLLPFLRLISLEKKSFQKTWKYFLKNILTIIKIVPILKLVTFICLVLILVLGLLSNFLSLTILQYLFSLIILFLIVYTYSSLRRYIYYSLENGK